MRISPSLARTAIALLAVAATPAAFAAWTAFGSGDRATYVDLDATRQQGDAGLVTFLASLPQPHAESDGSVTRSVESVEEFDCAGRRARTVKMLAFATAMGEGTPKTGSTAAVRPDDWTSVRAGTQGDAALALACGHVSLLDRRLAWQPLPGDAHAGAALQVDAGEAGRDGERVSVRWLFDAPAAAIRGRPTTASTAVKSAIDCATGQMQVTELMGFADPHGGGARPTLLVRTSGSITLDEPLATAAREIVRHFCSTR